MIALMALGVIAVLGGAGAVRDLRTDGQSTWARRQDRRIRNNG